ncbi:hypothetical protein [Curtobacterium sp. MCBD17_040]|uniref:hypothetical protein n=1 Tax=Curtobacterium sp. MCBD17_040 TaxID=2175674 RepID=UPI000DAA9E72|nr:hypothetical protein [Curtobacterium sp. MCBD17_040]WIB65613.1 hypothetical protein DEI94_15960 [Curtobacterium sp. MCBD17_040]
MAAVTKAPPAGPEAASATAPQDAHFVSNPYTRRKYGVTGEESPEDIVKVTFEVRRGDRDAFNAAFGAARLFEGAQTPKEVLTRIYNAETKRLEDAYNEGRPYERRTKQAPRGRPIGSDRQ